MIILDRYPLPVFNDMSHPMDGPRIRKSYGDLEEMFAEKEEQYYSKIELPNNVFLLKVGIDAVRKRKNDIDYNTHVVKVDAVNKIQKSKKIIPIDSNKPYSIVLLELKRRIWSAL